MFKNSVKNMIKEESTKLLGKNLHPQLSLDGLGNDIVGLFFGLVRGKDEEKLINEVNNILKRKNKEEIMNLFLIAFQTRWCRGGKGEKKLFYIIFTQLLQKYPEVCYDLLELIPHYGCWKDLRSLYYYNYCKNNEDIFLFEKMCDILEKQLRMDILELEKKEPFPKISLLSKYYSAKKCFVVKKKLEKRSKKSAVENRFFQELSERLYNKERKFSAMSRNYAEMTLRKKMVEMRKLLDIPEVKMCANKWAEINFGKVASLCMSRNTRAFLDEDKKGEIRHPEDEERKKCRENLIESLTKGVKGGQLYPNELVEKVLNDKISIGVQAVINSQWESLLENIKLQIKKRSEEIGKNDFDLTKCIVMSDVSGSMSGTPMMVSIGFGILVSQLTHESFRDLVMTFDSNPIFHNLGNENTFVKKVRSLEKAPWGGSTNFEGAMQLIINVIEKDNLKEEEIPKCLLVVSDMQFNAATGQSSYMSTNRGFGWGTAYDNIKNMFKVLGEKLYGHSISPPQIIFWNVEQDTVGFPASAEEEGVTLLSGYSPALLKFIFSGELEEEVEVMDEKGEIRKVKVKLTPSETLIKILGESALEPVRQILKKYFMDNN